MNIRTLLFLLMFTGAASAQSTAPVRSDTARISAALGNMSSADTVQALHRLYSQRRTGGLILTVIGGVYFLYVAAIAPIALAFGGASQLPAVATAGIIGAGTTGLNIRKLTRFNKFREAKLVADYERGQKLPPEIRRKLKPKHFRL